MQSLGQIVHSLESSSIELPVSSQVDSQTSKVRADSSKPSINIDESEVESEAGENQVS